MTASQPTEVLPENLPVQGPVERVPAPVSETAAILHMIERAARDPAVDVDKLSRLMEMRDKAAARQAELEFDMAMTAAQTEMGRVRADATNPSTKSKYASFAALDGALRQTYTKHGFALSFNTERTESEAMVRVACRVSHRAGHSRNYHIDMPADGKGAKGGDVMTKTHATGSAVSYGRRYLELMIFNIAVGEDDDGNAASGDAHRLSAEQVQQLEKLIEEVGANKQRFLAHIKCSRLEDILASNFDAAKKLIETKRKRK